MKLKKSLAALAINMSVAGFAAPAFASTYQIKPNDTLWKIANAHRIPVNLLQAANPHADPMNLQIGQKIQLPDPTENGQRGSYTVRGSDTFWTISRKLHVPLSDLLAANPRVDPLNLYPGLKLNIPSVSAGQTPSSSRLRPGQAGSKPQPAVTTASGQTVSYSRVISGVATAYTASAASNGKWGAVDYFGSPLKLGTIAVDPDVIPLGSKVYITGYSFPELPAGGMIAYARDTGGAIRGNRLDIFIPTSDRIAKNFGMQKVTVYILNPDR